MKNQILILVLTFLIAAISAQQPLPNSNSGKGVSPLIAHSSDLRSSSTYAVVVGISDYQDPGIPDLRFADKDAEAFANFLRSPAGGSLDNDHLKVLTNQNATAGRVAEALDGLIEQAKAGDEIIIYFSGHGDVEGKKISQPGFLLCWDSPSRVYMGGGTYSLAYLQEVVSTLSLQTKAKVVVVTDACHAGKLAGSQIGGAQLTAANLAKQYANEIKILSCQPGEFSLEGEQWGGGRGAFSYHLVDGMYGLADRNADGAVTLGEIDRYLEDHVTAEAAPQSQVPMLLGNKTEQIARVNQKVLADLKKDKSSMLKVFASTDSRGLEEEVLAAADSTIRQMYYAFKKAVKEKRFFTALEESGQSNNDCAEWYYNQLVSKQVLAPLHGILRRNYAAALQDDAQQVMNAMLKSGLTEEELVDANAARVYRFYPRYLERAAELLGESHYMYSELQARKYFFEGKIASRFPGPQAAYRKALHWQPDMPHVMAELIRTFKASEADSAYYYFSKARELVPEWVVPYMRLADYWAKTNQTTKVKEILEQAGQVDSNSVLVFYRKALFHEHQKENDDAVYWYRKAVAEAGTEICFPCAWTNLGAIYYKMSRIAEAEAAHKKAIQLDSNFTQAWVNLGSMYCDVMQKYSEAEGAFKKAIQMDSTNAYAWTNLSVVYRTIKRYPEAEAALEKAAQVDSNFIGVWITKGDLYEMTNRYTEALVAYNKAIQIDSNYAHPWNGIGAILCDRLRRYNEAEVAFKKAIQIDRNNPWTWCNLGNVYYYTQNYAECESAYHKALQIDSNFVNAWWGLVSILSKQKQTEKTFVCLEQALRKGYNDFDGMQQDTDLAPLREQKDRWDTLMCNALVPDTTDSKAWLNFGALYVRNQRYDDAESILKKSITLDANLAPAHYQLGRLYFKTNRPGDALKEFHKTIELSPQARMARLGMAWLLIAENKNADALEWVSQAIIKGGAPFDLLENDEDLAPLRSLPEWKELMKKYFPDKIKN